VPRELFAVERLHLKPLAAWIPEAYRLPPRTVDVEGYVALHTNRYSVPLAWIGRRVELRETKDQIEIQLDARNLVRHTRIAEAEHQRILLPQHRPPRGPGVPCANCCAWCASIHGSRCWELCGRPPATVSTTWTGWSA
jgi:hypothetical protein